MKQLVTRRDFLKVAGTGTLAVAAMGLTGCGGSQPAPAPTPDNNNNSSNNNNNNNNNNGNNNNNSNNNNNNKPDNSENSSLDVGKGKVYRLTNDIFDDTKTAIFDGEVAVGYASLACESIPESESKKYKDYDLLLAGIGIMNSSSGKIVDLEKTLAEALSLMSEDIVTDAGINKLFMKPSTYFTAKYGSTVLRAVAYGATAPINDTDNLNPYDTQLDPNEVGTVFLFILAPKGWNQINVRYTPNFAGKKYANFAFTRTDVTKTSITADYALDAAAKSVAL